MPEIEQDLSCADQSGKTNAHAEGRAIPGTSILGAQGTPEIAQEGASAPEIEQDLSCADQDGKADAHAKGHAIPGTSILGAQRAPEIAQEGTSKAQFNKEQLDRREAEKGKQ